MSRFVLSYQGNADPSSNEEGELVSALSGAQVIDRMPGTLLVDGSEGELARLVKRFTKWRLSPVSKVAVNPPRKRVLNAI